MKSKGKKRSWSAALVQDENHNPNWENHNSNYDDDDENSPSFGREPIFIEMGNGVNGLQSF